MKTVFHKTTISSFFLILLSMLVFNSCKKKTTNTTGGGSTSYTSSFSYKKGGSAQSVTSITAARLSVPYPCIAIIATTNSPSQSLNLLLDSATTVGTYPITLLNPYSLQFNDNTTFLSWASSIGSGFVTISKHDVTSKIIEGSFNAHLYDNTLSPSDSIIISEGIFKVKYQ